MSKNYAYRNLKLCTKDCLCLFVCPTHATDTETGQIDFEKCIGCGACAAACPSRAITMLPKIMPKAQKKEEKVVSELFKVARAKITEIKILNFILEKNPDDRLVKALIHSNKVIIEDLMREAGYMLPQSKNAHNFLAELKRDADDKTLSIIQKLLDKIEVNE